MPVISRFLGIVIKMYFAEHNPPHFHAFYGEYEGVFLIDSLELIKGNFPPRVIGLIIEWAELHRIELKKNWELLQEKKFNKIEPLV